MKATPEEYHLHQRILSHDDSTAFEELVNATYMRLIDDILKCANPTDNRHDVEEAVGKALLDYREKPERYQPERASLYAYLRSIAHNDFRDARRKESRHTGRQISLNDPSLAEHDFADDTEDMSSIAYAKELWAYVEKTLPNVTDRNLALLIINQVPSTSVLYIKLLGIEHLPEAEQRTKVKRERDRIVKHLRRLRRNIHE
jgi:DNA-directed RNA polymerase specialized sigma24 family protein